MPNVDDFNARIKGAIAFADVDMLASTWNKNDYHLDSLRAMNDTHVEVH